MPESRPIGERQPAAQPDPRPAKGNDTEYGTEPPAASGDDPTTPGPRRAARPGVRPLWTVIILLVLGAAGLWLSSRLTWEWSRQLSPVRGTVVASRRGSEVAPALVPLAVIAIAAVAAVLAIGGWSRRIVGILVGVAGLAGVWTGASGLPGVFGARSNGYPLSQVVTAHLVAVLAGLLLVAAAIQIFRNTATMPHLGGSYRTPSARRRDPDADLWQALSDGRDPTGDDRTDD